MASRTRITHASATASSFIPDEKATSRLNIAVIGDLLPRETACRSSTGAGFGPGTTPPDALPGRGAGGAGTTPPDTLPGRGAGGAAGITGPDAAPGRLRASDV